MLELVGDLSSCYLVVALGVFELLEELFFKKGLIEAPLKMLEGFFWASAAYNGADVEEVGAGLVCSKGFPKLAV